MAKKKSNPQSEDNNNKQIPDDAASEKLDSLKSLNSMLLKETVERRHQVDSLTQINVSLESELTRFKSDKVSWESELIGITERAMMLEIEKGLVSRFLAVQVKEMAEGLERDLNRVLEDKNAIQRTMNKRESEIGSLNSRVSTLAAEIAEEKFVLSKVCEERDEIREQLDERIRHEKVLKSKLAEAEKKEVIVSENSQKFKADYNRVVEEKIAIERKVDSVLREKDSVQRSLVESNGLVDELKRDIEKIVKEKKVIENERNVEEQKKNKLQTSVNELNALVHKLQKGEEQLVKKVADLEKKCVVNSQKEAEMSMEIDVLVKDKQEIEQNIQKLSQEKSSITNKLNEALKTLEHQKVTIDQMIKEKANLEEAKNQGDINISKLKQQLLEFKNTITTLEKSNVVQNDKLKQLESEVSRYKTSFDQATKESKNSKANLDEEKLTVKNLREKISKMEKGVEESRKKLAKTTSETEKLVSEKNKLGDELQVIKKSLAKTQKEHNDTKAKLKQSEANSSRILKMVKNTSSNCNSNDKETEFEEIVEMKKAFKEKDSIVQELKKQLEMLKVSVAKADKGKSFWTMVSSATTIIAAVSLAYVARVTY